MRRSRMTSSRNIMLLVKIKFRLKFFNLGWFSISFVSDLASTKIKNQHRLKSFKLNVILTCNIYMQCVCGRPVNTSNFRSRGPGFKPRPLCCFLWWGTLLHFVSLQSGVQLYKWVQASCCWGVTLPQTTIPSSGGQQYSLIGMLHVKEREISSSCVRPL